MRINYLKLEKVIHGLKTAIACVAGFLLARLIGFPADQWIVVSIIVVMCAQLYVGGTLQKSYLRFIGTSIGCLVATVTIMFTDSSFWPVLFTIAFAGFFFSFLATLKSNLTYMAQLGAVTTVIIMFGQPAPSLSLAGMRFLEISLGIVIAAVVSQFIFPIHARTHLRRSQALTMEKIKEFYDAVIINRFSETDYPDSRDTDETIVKNLIQQRALAKDSAREPFGKPFNPNHFQRTLFSERELLRSINFMDLALSEIENANELYDTPDIMKPFNDAVVNALDVLAEALSNKTFKEAHIDLPNVQGLIDEMHKHSSFSKAGQSVYIDGFIFSASILVNNLRDLAKLYQIKYSPEPVTA